MCSRPANDRSGPGSEDKEHAASQQSNDCGNRRDRHQYWHELVPRRGKRSAWCARDSTEMVAWPGRAATCQLSPCLIGHGGLRRRRIISAARRGQHRVRCLIADPLRGPSARLTSSFLSWRTVIPNAAEAGFKLRRIELSHQLGGRPRKCCAAPQPPIRAYRQRRTGRVAFRVSDAVSPAGQTFCSR
jgi:hypothetical protein